VLDEQILNVGSAGPIVLVTHHEVARLLLAHLDPHCCRRIESTRRTAAWTVLGADGGHWEVLDTEEEPTELEPGE